jgi:PPE-repeat protein
LNFAVLPPELNSVRMFTGAGLSPLLDAAAAWDGVAEELHGAAGSFSSVTSALTAQAWQGTASEAMMRAAGPYLAWLSTTAGQAEQTAAQARSAASVFEAARAAIVHPMTVAANRMRLVNLAAANLLGQNAPAIAAAEAEYEQMWAADVAVMSGYHIGASAAASQLAPFEEGLQILQKQLAGAYAASGLPAISIDFSTGTFNIGNGNIGVNNIGNGNIGNGNIGNGNFGDANLGNGNHGNWNIGLGITGNRQIGFGNPGNGGMRVQVVGNGGPGVTALIMGGTDSLLPSPQVPLLQYAAQFITPFYPGYTAQALETPSKFFPFTGLNSLTFNASVAQGVQDLHTAIMAQIAAGNHTVVFGVSQSSTVATLEMQFLQTLPAGLRPGTDQLSFVLTGNPDRPDGGIFARLPGFSVPGLGFTFFGATPANLYPTIDYSVQYDGVSDFPRYPLDVFATANAIAGIVYIHGGLGPAMPNQVPFGVVQPASPGSLTTYILIPTHNLPLLDPLRAVPLLGNPLADLIQPDLRVLVELGYDRTALQDVPTAFGMFPHVDPAALAAQLQQGAMQGITNALGDLGL